MQSENKKHVLETYTVTDMHMLQMKMESNQQRSLEEPGAVGPGEQKVVVITVGGKEHLVILQIDSKHLPTCPCRVTA